MLKSATNRLYSNVTKNWQGSPQKISLLHTQIRTRYSNRPKTPDLIYFPKISRWLANKVRLMLLKRFWDPDFSEGAFIYGTTRAICKITDIIHNDNPEALQDLVTMSIQINLIDEMSSRLTSLQKHIIKLEPPDIKMLILNNVKMKRDGLQRTCCIGMRVLALKWHTQTSGILNLALITLQTEFTRDYSVGVAPNWTISGFDILDCTLLAEAAR